MPKACRGRRAEQGPVAFDGGAVVVFGQGSRIRHQESQSLPRDDRPALRQLKASLHGADFEMGVGGASASRGDQAQFMDGTAAANPPRPAEIWGGAAPPPTHFNTPLPAAAPVANDACNR